MPIYTLIIKNNNENKQSLTPTRDLSLSVALNKHTPTSSGPAHTRKRYAIAWLLAEPGSERTMGGILLR